MLFALVCSFSVSTSVEPFRNMTSLDLISVENSNFSIIFTTTGCRKWNEDTNAWTMEDCTVRLMFWSFLKRLQFSSGYRQANHPRYH